MQNPTPSNTGTDTVPVKAFWKSKRMAGLGIVLAGLVLRYLSAKGVIGSELFGLGNELLSYLTQAFGLSFFVYGSVKAKGAVGLKDGYKTLGVLVLLLPFLLWYSPVQLMALGNGRIGKNAEQVRESKNQQPLNKLRLELHDQLFHLNFDGTYNTGAPSLKLSYQPFENATFDFGPSLQIRPSSDSFSLGVGLSFGVYKQLELGYGMWIWQEGKGVGFDLSDKKINYIILGLNLRNFGL